MGVIDLVQAFGQAWGRCDIEAILSMMAPHATYEVVPLPEVQGHGAIRAFISPNLNVAKRIEWDVLNIAVDASGSKVMAERVERFVFEEGTVVIAMMGIFEIEHGKIVRWRDYSDLGSFARGMADIGRMSPVTKSL